VGQKCVAIYCRVSCGTRSTWTLLLTTFRTILGDDVAQLSPLGYNHINFLGMFHFRLTESVKAGKLRDWNLEESLFGS
jgi:hypothetical protein